MKNYLNEHEYGWHHERQDGFRISSDINHIREEDWAKILKDETQM